MIVNLGRTLFSQVMDFVPWTSVDRIVARYGGDVRVRSLEAMIRRHDFTALHATSISGGEAATSRNDSNILKAQTGTTFANPSKA